MIRSHPIETTILESGFFWGTRIQMINQTGSFYASNRILNVACI